VHRESVFLRRILHQYVTETGRKLATSRPVAGFSILSPLCSACAIARRTSSTRIMRSSRSVLTSSEMRNAMDGSIVLPCSPQTSCKRRSLSCARFSWRREKPGSWPQSWVRTSVRKNKIGEYEWRACRDAQSVSAQAAIGYKILIALIGSPLYCLWRQALDWQTASGRRSRSRSSGRVRSTLTL